MSLLLVLLCAAPSQVMGGQDGFLSPKHFREVREELRGVLADVLGGGAHGRVKGQMERIERRFTPLFKTLPKSRAGHLSVPVMHYAVQRYFGEYNGWILKGFEAHSVMTNFSDFSEGTHLLQGKLPEYVLDSLQERFSTKGFGLKDTVGMIAALEILTFDEVLRGLQVAYGLNSVSSKSQLTHEELVEIITSYFIVEMLEGDSGNIEQHKSDKKHILDLYPHWTLTKIFALDVIENDCFERKSVTNPFHKTMFSFEDTSRIAERITEQFGPWSSHECHEIKDALAELDVHGTGRVKLSEFYASTKDGKWQFLESSEYLRQLGALDESSNELGPQVIISNYIQGMSNCITSTPYYSVCCQNECNMVYQHLEEALPESKDATWSMNHIEGAIEGTFDHNITASEMAHLNEIDVHHKGRIPLHGRLMAQWLHFVFPRECPFPHMKQSINPQTPASFESVVGRDAATASSAEIEQFLASEAAKIPPSPDAGSTMWIPHEVTLESASASHSTEVNFQMVLRTCATLGLLLGLAALIIKELAPRCAQVLGSAKKSSEFSI